MNNSDEAMFQFFQIFGKRWNGLIVATLMSCPAHFTDLRRAISGISERMLSDRLAELAEAGIVSRTVNEGPPLRVVYSLTATGVALEPGFLELRCWAHTHFGEGTP